MTHCAACSSPVPQDAGFCPACGAPQVSATNLPTVPQSGVHGPRLAGGDFCRRWAAVLGAIAFWGVLNGTVFNGPVLAAFGLLLVAVLIALLLRVGLVGLLVAMAVRSL